MLYQSEYQCSHPGTNESSQCLNPKGCASSRQSQVSSPKLRATAHKYTRTQWVRSYNYCADPHKPRLYSKMYVLWESSIHLVSKSQIDSHYLVIIMLLIGGYLASSFKTTSRISAIGVGNCRETNVLRLVQFLGKCCKRYINMGHSFSIAKRRMRSSFAQLISN